MSAERSIALVACGLCLGTPVLAAEEPAPDAEFLEYLGMWEESDEDWMVLDNLQALETEEQNEPEPVPEGAESTETKDES